jgi:hypothetical protein
MRGGGEERTDAQRPDQDPKHVRVPRLVHERVPAHQHLVAPYRLESRLARLGVVRIHLWKDGGGFRERWVGTGGTGD